MSNWKPNSSWKKRRYGWSPNILKMAKLFPSLRQIKTTTTMPASRFIHYPNNNKIYIDLGGSSTLRSSNQATTAIHLGATHKGSTSTTYQPRYKSMGPDMQRSNLCNFCGLDGHFERERSILDRMKNYEHILLE